jgi:HK97 family phage major capsid protein
MTFGKRELRPHPLAQYIKVSKKLIRASALGVEALVRDRLSYKAAVVMENAYLNGSGVNQPLGVFTALAGIGITTSRDVSTGNTVTEIKADGLIEAKYSIKPQYWPKLNWIFHRDGVKQIRKLKDGEGQYIWRAGISSDQGDSILDVPVKMSEYAPNTFTTGLYVGILGDFKKYWIADALGMEIQVLTELYAATNQNGYILRAESDGMPVIEEAFARVTLA